MVLFENYLNTVNTLINSRVPSKKLNKKLKVLTRTTDTKGIQNATEKKNRLFKKYIEFSDCYK